ncbi:uncharacterized protein LOC134291877 [Aedes albopictus]|uniref:PHD-type domain-containing protein n=1 Tax=Aedes albopictus TaxID=7160 RepID=A0ABM1ZAP0_AEDAL
MEEHRKTAGYSCKSCTRPDTDDEKWVACDSCKLWEHFTCAGVDDSVKNRLYLCNECQSKEAVPAASSSHNFKPPPSEGRSLRSSTTRSGLKPLNKVTQLASQFSRSANSTTSSTRAARLQAQMKLVEEEQLLKEQELEAQEAMRKKEMEEEERRLEERKALLEEEARLRQRKLQEEKEFQKKQQMIRKESLEKKNTLARQLSECSSRAASIPDSEQQVAIWLQQCSPDPLVEELDSLAIGSRTQEPLIRSNLLRSAGDQRPIVIDPARVTRDALQQPIPRNSIEALENHRTGGVQDCSRIRGQEALRHQNVVNQNQTDRRVDTDFHSYSANRPLLNTADTGRRSPVVTVGPDRNECDPCLLQQPHTNPEIVSLPVVLNASQLASRQVMGKELPPFSGNPEDWPIFICSFEHSTAACGYTDAENLIRLQRCLKGHALESVRSRLLLPSSVPQVINTLRTLYGRPELLIRTLIEKVRCTPSPRHDRLETVVEFGLVVQNLVDHLKAAKQYTHLSNPILMQELVEKLPGSLKMDWAIYQSKQPYATLATFGDFMTGLLEAASQVTFEIPSQSRNIRGEQRRPKEKGLLYAHSTMSGSSLDPTNSMSNPRKSGKPCAACEREGHRVADCNQFKSLNNDERWQVVHQRGLCCTCLNGHGKWPCRSWQGCGFEGCREKHHTLLHPNAIQPSINVPVNNIMQKGVFSPMFRVLPVVLYAGALREIIFAFVDEGSSTTFLEEAVADRLGLSGPVEPLTLQWTGNVTREEQKSRRVQMEISGEENFNLHKLCEVRTVSCLVLPTQSMKYSELCVRYPHLRGLPLKDYESIQPKLLIGLDNLRLVVPLKVREGGPTDPIAAKCRLGWSIYGCAKDTSTPRAVVHFHAAAPADSDRQLNDQLRDYFALEDSGICEKRELLESNEEKRAREILQQTTRRTKQGFETGLLWRNDDPDFPDSYPMAVRRLKALERKLAKDPWLQERVCEQISEYLQKGYAHKATPSELTNADRKRVWFLPLGVVVHPRKPNKVRLVWDAAATVNGVSFNSKLLKGPDLLTPLPSVLSRFRQFPVAICGDIKEMFHQLSIRKEDRLAQCFLWRNNPAHPIQVFVMDVATFGATCSPASAQYVKNLNAEEFAVIYPRAAAAIVKNHYVDDYLDSFITVEDAVDVVKEVKLVHSLGGFEIRGFRSNSMDFLREIGEPAAYEPKNLILERCSTIESVLGMSWDPATDCFSYSFNLRDDMRSILDEGYVPTKREVLKVVMSLFDPLGLVSHFLVHGKVIIQGTWAAGTGWDEPINKDLNQKWRQWVELFPKLNELKISRCYFSSFPSSIDDLQVHIFVDASDIAYSCVVYFRLLHEGRVQTALVGAKSKVAPIKTLSTPRLELKAAVLGVRFVAAMLEYHSLPVCSRFFWSDSTTVLAWIRSDHRKFHKFVSVRVGEILTLSEPQEWRWVQSKLNVSDDATKWKDGPNLDCKSPWLNGPTFLHLDEAAWPEQQIATTTHEELRIVQTHWNREFVVDYSRFNNWTRLQRTIAYVIRFMNSLRRRNVGQNLRLETLTQEELSSAEVLLWKMAQEEVYPEERSVLIKPRLIHLVVIVPFS